jgi:hypothetical protein
VIGSKQKGEGGEVTYKEREEEGGCETILYIFDKVATMRLR